MNLWPGSPDESQETARLLAQLAGNPGWAELQARLQAHVDELLERMTSTSQDLGGKDLEALGREYLEIKTELCVLQAVIGVDREARRVLQGFHKQGAENRTGER